jgi:G:T/U-mismatch repair DNA glycosylase
MDILFVALNPPVDSNEKGHYFSHNLSFWNLLYDCGLITQRVENKLTGDEEVFRSNGINYRKSVYGVTDLVHDIVETNSNKVKTDKSRVDRILKIIDDREVKLVCLMHSAVGIAFEQEKLIVRQKEYGTVGLYNGVSIYEVPFHSAFIGDKVKYYRQLKEKL